MENQLVKFVQRRRKTVGVVVAEKFPGIDKIYISGSLCHIGLDTFNKKTAVALAESRAAAMALKDRMCMLPYTLKPEVTYMTDRARRYFKGMDIITPEIHPIKTF